MRRTTVAMLAAVSLSGCQSLSEGAREGFSKENTCPIDRVEVRDRPDLKVSSFDTDVAKPPPAIAADPQRRAMWQQKQEQARTAWDDTEDIEEARGCDKQAFYRCHHPNKHAFRASCSTVMHVPPGISHW